MSVQDFSSTNEGSDIGTLDARLISTPRHVCAHDPRCPDAGAEDRDAARSIVSHPEQGWNLLCNGVVLFDDSGEILPDGHCLQARRAELTAAALHRRVA